ncbi:hypothetical protein TNCV_1011601 [Trichonephila clavipes]|uniref:Uncharacterized protein n=1 Tax=Trichonephila clavipes TaxID=2585209 RepID=A0A8X7BAX9_TRICX|nr:hypothetical protein TNCV_1011601 [Trichonephila clavipes]
MTEYFIGAEGGQSTTSLFEFHSSDRLNGVELKRGVLMFPFRSGQTNGRLNKTCKNDVPRTILISLVRDSRFGDNFAKELQFIPLSNDTVARRDEDIAEDVEQQPFCKLRDELFSIQLDETTDSN